MVKTPDLGFALARPKVYLAGPDVFLPDAIELGERKKAICARFGFEGVFPLDSVPERGESPEETGLAIFDICVEMMNECQLAIANLTPFRGVSMDVGTAVEIGYMFGKGKEVFGYTNVGVDYRARVEAWKVVDGLEVEDFGFFDNLMCEGVIRHSGGVVVRKSVRPESVLTDLQGFEECVREAAQIFSNPEAS